MILHLAHTTPEPGGVRVSCPECHTYLQFVSYPAHKLKEVPCETCGRRWTVRVRKAEVGFSYVDFFVREDGESC